LDEPANHEPRREAWWAFWLAQTAFWALAFAANLLLIAVFSVADPVGYVALEVAACFLATSAMRTASRHERLLARLGISKAGLLVGGILLSAVLISLILLAARPVFGLPAPTRGELVARLTITFAMLATWSAFSFGFQLIGDRYLAEIRALQAESLALRNELKHLQAQISPHFLFNALNTVMAHRHDPDAIDTVTQALANYLDFLLRPSAPLEPLARELEALEEYLTVQSMRFGDALETRIDCDFDARRIAVLPVMVQPLVENAIKYGGRTSPKPLRVRVAARREGDWLTVEVANTGRWVAAGTSGSTGTGLASLERRLQMVVGPAATATHREEDGWVRVLIRVPAVEVRRPAGHQATAEAGQ